MSLRAKSVGAAFKRTLQLRLQTLQVRRTTYAKATVAEQDSRRGHDISS